MNRIFITGDLHATIDMHKLSTKAFPEQKELNKDDYVIICGDFGGVWDGGKGDAYLQNWLEAKSFTTLFVAGNHENFNLLNLYKVELWNGGLVHKIKPNVIHLITGQSYSFADHTWFIMGGATSIDKAYRKENISWWKEEMPSDEEYEIAFKTLDDLNWKVDYVLTHCAPDSIQALINSTYEHDKLTNFLETISWDLDFKAWFFGHYHTNKKLAEKFFALYEQIIEILT